MNRAFSVFIKFLFIFIIGHFLFSVFFTNFFENNQKENATEQSFNLQNGPKAIATTTGWKSTWNDYDNNYYSGVIKVRNSEVLSSIWNKSRISAESWGGFYGLVGSTDTRIWWIGWPICVGLGGGALKFFLGGRRLLSICCGRGIGRLIGSLGSGKRDFG